MKKKDLAMLSQGLIIASVLAVLLAAVGYIGIDIWLASTQWLLVATVLALFSIYTKR